MNPQRSDYRIVGSTDGHGRERTSVARLGRDLRPAGSDPGTVVVGRDEAATDGVRRLGSSPIDAPVESHHDDHREPERPARRVDDVTGVRVQLADKQATGVERI